MSELPPRQGYLRTGVTYQSLEWLFEVMSEQPRTAIVTIRTLEGAIDIGLVEEDARQLRDSLSLFLYTTAGGKS